MKNPKSLWRRLKGYRHDPLFVYQMGKVGSRTVANTLEPYYYIRHSHLSSVFDEQMSSLGLKKGSGLKGEPINLISIVRDPIAREISAFFQNIDNEGHKCYMGPREEVLKMDIELLMDSFTANIKSNLEYILNWFDLDFINSTDVNIYDYKFDQSQGWGEINDLNFKILLLRLEDSKQNFVEALNCLLSNRREGAIEIDKLCLQNVSSEKWYYELMKQFKNQITFDTKLLEQVYSSQFCKHFYTEDERGGFYEKWEQNGKALM